MLTQSIKAINSMYNVSFCTLCWWKLYEWGNDIKHHSAFFKCRRRGELRGCWRKIQQPQKKRHIKALKQGPELWCYCIPVFTKTLSHSRQRILHAMRNQQVADHKSILSVFHHCGMVAATGCLLFIANISVLNADELYENNTTLSYSYSPVYSILMPFIILILDSPLR